MTARVISGLRIVSMVGSRPDPTRPLAAGQIARGLGLSLSSTSRACAALVEEGLLARGAAYGSYVLGEGALEVSGLAQAPSFRGVRAALTRVVQRTGETAFVAARANGGMRVTSTVSSPWTLYSPASIGEEIVDDAGAVARVASGEARGVTEGVRGKSIEVAVPLLDSAGVCVAALAVRLPANRAKEGVALARGALADERRAIERLIARTPPSAVPDPPANGGALAVAAALLRTLARGSADVATLAEALGVRRDRVQRLVESCRTAGLVRDSGDGEGYALEWFVHGWSRAALLPTLVDRGASVVARTADETGACAFITVLRGMRSVTLVEELRDQGEGLEMTPWLGRPCPLPSSDGGPVLVHDFSDADIRAMLGGRREGKSVEEFLSRAHDVARDGVVAKESFEEAGQTAIAAPIRDVGGAVVAAACLVGATDLLRPRARALEAAARTMSAELSALLGYRAPV